MSEQLAEVLFRSAAESVEVSPPPYDAVVERSRQQRRRHRRVVAGGAAAALVVVGLATWAATRPEPAPGPLPSHVVAVRNPVSVPWYADGRLHLRAVTVDVPDVTDVAAVGQSVVYVDEQGAVGIVDAAGERRIVGEAVPGSRVLGSAANGWAVWLQPDDGDGGVSIVVWSVAVDGIVAQHAAAPEAELVAVDQDLVYFQNDMGAFLWSAGVSGTQPELLGLHPLADVASATRVFQHGHRIEMVQPFFNVSFVRVGDGATVSPGGTSVLTRRPGPWEPGTPYVPLMWDPRSGDRRPTGIASDERVVDGAFGPNRDITYFVEDVADLGGVTVDGELAPLLVLRTCELEASQCQDVLPVRTGGGRAMFAH